ncbi:MAG: beta-galactosidase [Arachnia sp.]
MANSYRGLGVAYYPEHWDRSLWEEDVVLMLDHGLDTLRIAEFAWGLLEPRDGVFDIGWFDDFLAICERLGMKVIFCTPTATPPMWMQHDHPGILNRDREGNAIDGPRRNYSYNSPEYRAFSERIVERLAEHYGAHPAIVGWQIDNELNCEVAEFFADGDHDAFRGYLREKFGTLEALNEALGTTFWSRTYSDWDQVRLGGPALYGSLNPHLALEERRFFSRSAVEFTRMQVEVLRRYVGDDVWITTNGLFPNLDYNALVEAGLDFITFDSYPNFAYDVNHRPADGDLLDRKWSWSLAWTRSISRTFGIMEQQAGAHGWTNRMEAPMPKPGQLRLWSLQSVAHGADMVSYFRWRTSPMGLEIYWHGLNDYANTPNRRLAELRSFADDWAALAAVQGAGYEAKVGVLKDYDNEFDASLDDWHGRVARASDDAWFRATQASHTPCDFVYLGAATPEQLASYDLLVYPHAALMTPERSELLRAYVEGGGTLVLGARTGYKDETGRCPIRPMPGLVGDWAGVVVDDYTLVGRDTAAMTVDWAGTHLAAPVFNEVLRPTADDVEVLARFTQDYYAGAPALTRRTVGEGVVYYLGACFSEELADRLLDFCDVRSPFADVVEAPPSVELAVRGGDGGRFLFLLNYPAHEARLTLNRPVVDLFTGETLSGEVVLSAYGVLVAKL